MATQFTLDQLEQAKRVTEPSFIVYQHGGGYALKSGTTGEIIGVFQSSDAAIRDAISRLPSGGQIHLKAGIHIFNNPVTLESQIRITGEGRHNTYIRAANGAFTWTAKNNIEISDVTIDGVNKSGNGITISGNWGANQRSYTCVIKDAGVINFNNGIVLNCLCESWIDNVKFHNNNSSLVLQDGCINNIFSRLQFFAATRGILIQSSQQRCEGDIFRDIIMVGVSKQLEIQNAHFIVFDNCVFDYGADTTFVYIQGGTYITFKNCWFASQNASDGRVLIRPDTTDTTFITFINCVFAFNKYYGLHIANSGATGKRPSDIIITACKFANNGTSTDGGDIIITNGDRIRIFDCEFLSTTPPYTIAETGAPTNIMISRCRFSRGTTGLLFVSNANVLLDNIGVTTENSGTATISAGSTSVTVNHGLSFTPDRIIVTPQTNLGGRSFWVSNVSSSSFTINISSSDTSAHTFYWYAARTVI